MGCFSKPINQCNLTLISAYGRFFSTSVLVESNRGLRISYCSSSSPVSSLFTSPSYLSLLRAVASSHLR